MLGTFCGLSHVYRGPRIPSDSGPIGGVSCSLMSCFCGRYEAFMKSSLCILFASAKETSYLALAHAKHIVSVSRLHAAVGTGGPVIDCDIF